MILEVKIIVFYEKKAFDLFCPTHIILDVGIILFHVICDKTIKKKHWLLESSCNQ